MTPTCLFKIQSIRRLATARPVRALFFLALIGVLALSGGSPPAPALAQGPDPAVVVIHADKRHFRPDVVSRTFGNEAAPEKPDCQGTVFHLFSPVDDLSGYDLAVHVTVDLRAGSVLGTVSGSGTKEIKRGTATCTWEGTADQDPYTPFVRDEWRFSAKGELTLRCTGEYVCAGMNLAPENQVVVAGTVERDIPFEISGKAKPGEEPLLYVRGAWTGETNDLPIEWFFSLASNKDAPPLGVTFPAYPLEEPTEAPTATPAATTVPATATPTSLPAKLTPEGQTDENTPTPRPQSFTPEMPGVSTEATTTIAPESTPRPTRTPSPGPIDPKKWVGPAVAVVGVGGAGVAAVGAAAWLVSRRARAARTKRPPAQSSGQANQLQAMRAHWQQALAERTRKVIHLEEERDRLARRIHDLAAQHELECTTGAVDGILDGANLFVSIVGGPATAVGAAGLNAALDVARLGVRAAVARRLGTASGIDPLTDAAKLAAGAAGVPLQPNAPGGAAGQALQNAAARHSRSAIRGMGRALGPLQGAVTMGQNAHKHARRAAWLRSQLKGARSRHALINRQLMDARAAMDEARSALQSANNAIQQLKAQFPQRFANL